MRLRIGNTQGMTLSNSPPASAASSSIASEGWPSEGKGAGPASASGMPPEGTNPGVAVRESPSPARFSASTASRLAGEAGANFARARRTSSTSPARAKACGAAGSTTPSLATNTCGAERGTLAGSGIARRKAPESSAKWATPPSGAGSRARHWSKRGSMRAGAPGAAIAMLVASSACSGTQTVALQASHCALTLTGRLPGMALSGRCRSTSTA